MYLLCCKEVLNKPSSHFISVLRLDIIDRMKSYFHAQEMSLASLFFLTQIYTQTYQLHPHCLSCLLTYIQSEAEERERGYSRGDGYGYASPPSEVRQSPVGYEQRISQDPRYEPRTQSRVRRRFLRCGSVFSCFS